MPYSINNILKFARGFDYSNPPSKEEVLDFYIDFIQQDVSSEYVDELHEDNAALSGLLDIQVWMQVNLKVTEVKARAAGKDVTPLVRRLESLDENEIPGFLDEQDSRHSDHLQIIRNGVKNYALELLDAAKENIYRFLTSTVEKASSNVIEKMAWIEGYIDHVATESELFSVLPAQEGDYHQFISNVAEKIKDNQRAQGVDEEDLAFSEENKFKGTNSSGMPDVVLKKPDGSYLFSYANNFVDTKMESDQATRHTALVMESQRISIEQNISFYKAFKQVKKLYPGSDDERVLWESILKDKDLYSDVRTHVSSYQFIDKNMLLSDFVDKGLITDDEERIQIESLLSLLPVIAQDFNVLLSEDKTITGADLTGLNLTADINSTVNEYPADIHETRANLTKMLEDLFNSGGNLVTLFTGLKNSESDHTQIAVYRNQYVAVNEDKGASYDYFNLSNNLSNNHHTLAMLLLLAISKRSLYRVSITESIMQLARTNKVILDAVTNFNHDEFNKLLEDITIKRTFTKHTEESIKDKITIREVTEVHDQLVDEHEELKDRNQQMRDQNEHQQILIEAFQWAGQNNLNHLFQDNELLIAEYLKSKSNEATNPIIDEKIADLNEFEAINERLIEDNDWFSFTKENIEDKRNNVYKLSENDMFLHLLYISPVTCIKLYGEDQVKEAMDKESLISRLSSLFERLDIKTEEKQQFINDTIGYLKNEEDLNKLSNVSKTIASGYYDAAMNQEDISKVEKHQFLNSIINLKRNNDQGVASSSSMSR